MFPETFLVINSSNSFSNSHLSQEMLVPAEEVHDWGRLQCHILLCQCADSSAADKITNHWD